MKKSRRVLRHLVADETAVTLIEYALVGALIAAVCAAAVATVGDNVGLLYLRVCNEVSTAISGAPVCLP